LTTGNARFAHIRGRMRLPLIAAPMFRVSGVDLVVAASTNGGHNTGYAQITVTNEGGGTSVLDVTDPTGDDNGPGTYQYPTSSAFTPGSFDFGNSSPRL